MPRSVLHATDALLGVGSYLVVKGGPHAAGIRAIAERSGSPYRSFGSRDA